MKLPIDKTWAIAITMVVTYAISVAVLLIERRAGDAAADAPTTVAPMTRPDAPAPSAGPRRLGPQGMPAQGPRSRQTDPSQGNPG